MSTTSIAPGDICLAEIPFTSGSPGKVRPALVLWLDVEDCVVCSITSSGPRTERDLNLIDWAAEGLLHASTCRLGRLNTMERRLLIRRIGHISPTDATEVLRVWRSHIRPAWAER